MTPGQAAAESSGQAGVTSQETPGNEDVASCGRSKTRTFVLLLALNQGPLWKLLSAKPQEQHLQPVPGSQPSGLSAPIRWPFQLGAQVGGV